MHTLPPSLDILLKILTPCLVVGGWIVVYRLQALQARRKVLREMVDKVRQEIEELQAAAIKFHTSDFDLEAKINISLSLTRIEKSYQLFPQIASGTCGCFPAVDPKKVVINPGYMVDLRRAITLKHFDEPGTPLKITDCQVQDIMAASAQLLSAVNDVMVAALD